MKDTMVKCVMKPCIGCKEFKPLSEYYSYKRTKTNSSRDGLFHRCKKCLHKRQKEFREANRESEKLRVKTYNHKVRMDVYSHYGGAKCNCCGEEEIAFLSIDHVEGGGIKHRKEQGITGGGYALSRWIIKNGYPEGFQVLCHNCNQAKHIRGICPHKSKATPVEVGLCG